MVMRKRYLYLYLDLIPILAAWCAVVCTAPASAQAIDFSAVTARANALVRDTGLTGAVLTIIRDNQVLYRQAFGSYTVDTQTETASAAKWIAGAAIATTVERGEMRWNSKAGDYFAGLPADKAAVTLEQLMSHTSGIDNSDDAPCLADRATTLDACARQILERPLIGVPGQVFSYGGNSMQVAGRMAEIATGKDWNQLFRERIATPLGMTRTDYAPGFAGTAIGFTAVGNPRIAGGMRTDASDYAALVNMFVRNGIAGNGTAVLKPRTIVEMDRNRQAGTSTFNTPFAESKGYAIGHWINSADATGRALTLSSPGAYGLTPWVNRSLGYAAVWLVRGRFGSGKEYLSLIDETDKAIAAATAPNETGFWWNPQASGTGVAFSRQGDLLFAALYGYGADLSAQWLVAPAMTRGTDGVFRGDLYAGAGAPNNVASTRVGTMEVGAPQSGSNKRTFRFDTPVRAVSSVIEPFVFKSNTYCRATADTRDTLTNLTDVWWDPALNGNGVAMAEQSELLFAAIYRFDAAGQPRWYIASGVPRDISGVYSGPLYVSRATGTQDQPNPVSAIIGTFTLTPVNGRAATLRYDINGAVTTMNLQRFDFAAPPTACY
jgi:CubicO group peptidase (beta-lactamase class C family)